MIYIFRLQSLHLTRERERDIERERKDRALLIINVCRARKSPKQRDISLRGEIENSSNIFFFVCFWRIKFAPISI